MSKQNISVTVDIVVFLQKEDTTSVLLIERGNPPFKGRWALPGGFVEDDEDLETAARRELKEETGMEMETCEQLYTFGKPGRDPRGRTISIAYVGFSSGSNEPKAADDAKEAKWIGIKELPKLAFDHSEIINLAISRFPQALP